MGIITSGKIGVRPLHVSTDKSLEDLRDTAISQSYPRKSADASDGWGSSADDDSAINESAIARLTVGEPEIIEADERLPRRLRLRYYWDQLNRAAARSIGDSGDWRRLHLRRAVDFVVFDSEAQGGYSILMSARDHRLATATPLPALRALMRSVDESAVVSFDTNIPSLPVDFFAWLLYRLQMDGQVAPGIHLDSIEEISSVDGSFRGARFTDKANLERIELAALITMGEEKFGPAKVKLSVDPLDASIHVELFKDGGFNIFRTSEYDSRQIPEDLFGHALVEDVWAVVLPRLRAAYYEDGAWAADGRDKMRSLAVDAIRKILPNETSTALESQS